MLKQIKELVDEGKFQQSLQMSLTILQQQPQNKPALLFSAQSYIGLGNSQAAQAALNALWQISSRPEAGKLSQEDQLYYQSLLVQKKIAIFLQTNANGNKKMFTEGINIQIENQYQILDYLDKKGQYDKMLEEVEAYALLCIQAEQPGFIEDTYIWLFQHHALSADIQLKYGCLIFYIDEYYKPKVNLETHFPKVVALFKEVVALKLSLTKNDIENLVGLAKRLLAFIDRQSWKKDIYSAIQAFNQNQNAVLEYKRYADNLIAAGDIYYHYNTLIEYAGSDSAMTQFARYLCCKQIMTPLNSPEWDAFIKTIQHHANDEFQQNCCGDLQANPIQVLINAFLDFNQVLLTGSFPSSNDHTHFEMISRGYRDQALAELEKFAENYGKMSPIVNAYYAICLLQLPADIQTKADYQQVFRRLEQADFLTRKIYFFKLVGKKQPSDICMVLQALKVIIVQQFQEKERVEQMDKIEQAVEKQIPYSTPTIVALYQAQLAQIRWTKLCDQGQWQTALQELDQLAELNASKRSWATLNQAWIKLSFLNQIAQNEESRKALLEQLFNELKQIGADKNDDVGSTALLLAGKISMAEGFTETAEALWLDALKRDQTKPEIFYSLATWYHFIAGDIDRAKKCAEKALLLKPDFEQAFLLLFELTSENEQEAVDLINRVLRMNRTLASAYYFKGLLMQNQGEYLDAIENLQNATKFYSLDRQKKDGPGLKPKYMKLYEVAALTQKPVSLFQSKLGVFGVHPTECVSAWIQLTECFAKIDKPQVTLKCFQKSMEDIAAVVKTVAGPVMTEQMHEQSRLANSVLQSLKGAHSFTTYSYDKQNESMQITLDLLDNLMSAGNAPDVIQECISCLLLGASLVKSNELAIKISAVALKAIRHSSSERVNLWQLLELAIHQILFRQAAILQQVTPFNFGNFVHQDESQTLCVRQIVDVADNCKEFNDSMNIQKVIQAALLVVSTKASDAQLKQALLKNVFERSSRILNKFFPQEKKDIGPARRELVVDAAKIAHQCWMQGVQIEGVDFVSLKVTLARRAIALEPLRAELWLLLYNLLPDEHPMKAQALYKAYDLEEDSPYVQSMLIKHYLKSPNSYKKAFRVIVKSYQQSINQNEENPIVIATLALLNARSCFIDKQIGLKDRKAHMIEALSLIEQINQDELFNMFAELRYFLMQEKGDYLEPLKFLNYVSAKPEQTSGILKLLLLQAYMGTSFIGFDSVREQYDKFSERQNLSQDELNILMQLKFIFEIEDVPVNALKAETEATIEQFAKDAESACRLASKLVLLQEVCLQLNILPDANLLDSKSDVFSLCDSLDSQQERMILAQSLRFLHRRDGKIMEQTAIRDEGINNQQQQEVEQNLVNYSRFLTQFSRLSNPVIPQLTQAQHKALLRLYLEMNPNFEESHTLKMHNSQNIDNKDHKLKGLQTIITKLKTDLTFAQKELMKNPLCISAHINWIWSLFHKGQSASAVKAFGLLQTKIVQGQILNNSQAEFDRLSKFIQLFTSPPSQPLNGRFELIAAACKQIQSARQNPEASDDVFEQINDSVAISLVKSVVSVDVSMWPQLLNDVFHLLRVFVFDQRQLTIFNKVIARMLQMSVALLSPNAFTSDLKGQSAKDKQLLVLINDLWVYKVLHTASALTELKKFAGCDVECNTADKVLNTGLFKRSPLPAQMLKARAYMLVKNFQKSNEILELTTDQVSTERDFVVALNHYAQQAYKQFYLSAIGLVAGCKSSVDKLAITEFEARRQHHFDLAYAYYLRAFAEATFLAARKQNLILQEDFTDEIDSQLYREAYFLKKTKASLQKCADQLFLAGDSEGLLSEAVKQMQAEINKEIN